MTTDRFPEIARDGGHTARRVCVSLLCALAAPAAVSAQPSLTAQQIDPEHAPAPRRPPPVRGLLPPPVQVSPSSVMATRYTLAGLSIALNAAAFVGFYLNDQGPSGPPPPWVSVLRVGGQLVTVPVYAFRLDRSSVTLASGFLVALEGVASPLALATASVAIREIFDRPGNFWVGALIGASVYNTFNAPLVWINAASDPVALWTSAGVGLATSVGGVALALTEADRETVGVTWALTALSIAATVHQTLWAVIGRAPEPPEKVPSPRRASLSPSVMGRGLGVSLTGVW